MKKNHYLTLPRYKRKLHPTLLQPMSRKKKLRNRRIQMTHIQDHLYIEDIYRKAYNRAISMILGGTFKVEAHVILDDYAVFFPWYNRGNLQSIRAFKKYNGF